MTIAGMPDPVKTIEVTPSDFPLVIKIDGADDILYLAHGMTEEDGAVVEVASIWDGAIMFTGEFPVG